MTPEQIAHFSYWLTETTDHRGAKSHSGRNRVAYIKDILIPIYLKKYPEGLLTGWTSPEPDNQTNQ